MAAGGDGTAAAATETKKSDNRKHTKMSRNTMAKTGTGVLDVLMQERQTV